MTEGQRVENLLAMILIRQMEGASDKDRMQALSRAGFSNAEIAALLGKKAGVVGQQLYLSRQTRRRPAKKVKGRTRRAA